MKRYEYNYGKNPEGVLSTISGYATETTNYGETAFGILNKSTRDDSNYTTPEVVSSSIATLFSVGNGTDHQNRKNIIELKADGTVYISGVGQYDGTNPGEATSIADEFQGIHDDITGVNEDIDRIDNTIESIHISEDNANLIYTLLVDGQERGTINIPRDQFLKNVSYNEETNNLEFTFIVRGENNEEVEKQVNVNMTDLEDIYSAGNGLNLENKQFSVKVDADTQPYIKVSSNGVKIIGINEALDTKVDWQENKTSIYLPVNGSITALRNDGQGGGVLICQRSYDDETTYVTEVGTTMNNLTLNSTERPKIDFADGTSENIAYQSEITDISSSLDNYLPLTGGTLTGKLDGTLIGADILATGRVTMIGDDHLYIYGIHDANTYLTLQDSNNNIVSIGYNGVRIPNKKASDLLHAAGGTYDISELETKVDGSLNNFYLNAYSSNQILWSASFKDDGTNGTSVKLSPATKTNSGAFTSTDFYIYAPLVTSEANGVMSKEDKTKLDSIDIDVLATKDDLDGYLPLTGGTVTGILGVNSNLIVKGSALLASADISAGDYVGLTVHGDSVLGGTPGVAVDASNIYILNNVSNAGTGSEDGMVISKEGISISGKTEQDLLNAAGSTTSISDILAEVPAPDLSPYATKEEVGSNTYTDSNYLSKETNLTDAVLQLDEEIKATNDNLDLEHANAEAAYAKKTELDGYLPLSGGTLTGYLKMRELDGSELKHETFSLDLVQGYFDSKDAYMKFDVHPSDYSTNRTMIEIGNLIDSNTTADSSDVLGIYSDFFQARFNPISRSFAVCNRPNTSKDVMWSNITLAPRDDDEAYVRITSYLGDSKDPSNFNQAIYKSTGITFRNKTASDLLHAAGGTVSIQDIIAQANVPTNVSQLTNDAGYQTEAQVSAKVASLVDSAPETLDTLNELAAALGDDPNFATTVTNQIAQKADKTTATTSTDGLMSAADKTRLDNSIYDFKVYPYNYSLGQPFQSTEDGLKFALGYRRHSSPNGEMSSRAEWKLPLASDDTNGLMSIADKAKLDSVTIQDGDIVASGFRITNGTANEVLTADGDSNTLKTINGQTLLGSGDITIPTPTVNAVLGTKTIWTGTQSDYDRVTTKDSNTLYFITEG